jgi:tol-pal system protein YbgF
VLKCTTTPILTFIILLSWGNLVGAVEYNDVPDGAASPEEVAQDAQTSADIYTRRSGGRPLAPKLVSRIEQLEQSLQAVNNQMEQLNHRCLVLQQNYDRLVNDLEVRFREVTTTLTAVPPSATPTTSPADGVVAAAATKGPSSADMGNDAEALTPPSADADNKEKYAYAKNLFNNGDYTAAEKAFKDFIKEYPKDVFGASAHYWLGESQLLLTQPKKAAVTFMNGYKKFPKSKKCPDNLLGLAKALEKMGDKTKACTTLEKIKNDYPDLSAELKKSVRQHQKSLKCGD